MKKKNPYSKRIRNIQFFSFLFIIILLVISISNAQELKTRVSVNNAKVRLEPDFSSPVVSVVSTGLIVPAIRKNGEWYFVELPPNEKEDVLAGYIHQSEVEEAGIEQKEKDNMYSELLSRVLKGDKTVNFRDLRLAYTKTEEYNPYQFGFDTGIYKEMYDGFAEKNYTQAIAKAEIILEENYLDIDSHVICAESFKRLGDQKKSEFHEFVATGLISSILNSGDGKSLETAYEVLSIREEKAILKVLGYQLMRTALISQDGHSYDRMEVVNRKTGEGHILYFNVDFPLVKALIKK